MEITILGIEKRFGSLQALHPIELSIGKGEFISLLGPSGCGKTTLLRMIAGLETPDGGEIKFGEKVIFSYTNKIEVSPQKRKIGMVFQDFALWPHMTVYENVAYSLKATGQKKGLKEKVIDALENVQLKEYADRYPHQLSGGQQQRVAFARAIASMPSIILLDEPLSALDATLRDDMRLLLQTLVSKLGVTAVYVTHDQHEAMAMSDRIVVMKKGKVIQVDTPEKVYHQPLNETVASFVGRGVILNGQPVIVQGKNLLALNEHVSIPFVHKELEAFASKEDVKMIIRPEQVKLTDVAQQDSISAVVESSSFFGERYEVLLRIKKSKQTLLAYVSKRYSVGEEVYCHLDTDRIHLIEKSGGKNIYETA
ncbi:ABC transporter ATP-binding protein [Alkalihalobacillus sp. BA299]|uniref:ABC transporter ATP-binding protein n=1 Tax=Alkalihalobacillus sp. BA299 TaxID=2815938 RepID=UPI001ADA55CB|nr:ABC transporter ATP-binding protein [Alkalihalobacillus sp. BA299]